MSSEQQGIFIKFPVGGAMTACFANCGTCPPGDYVRTLRNALGHDFVHVRISASTREVLDDLTNGYFESARLQRA